jgi:hypothetical protein
VRRLCRHPRHPFFQSLISWLATNRGEKAHVAPRTACYGCSDSSELSSITQMSSHYSLLSSLPQCRVTTRYQFEFPFCTSEEFKFVEPTIFTVRPSSQSIGVPRTSRSFAVSFLITEGKHNQINYYMILQHKATVRGTYMGTFISPTCLCEGGS